MRTFAKKGGNVAKALLAGMAIMLLLSATPRRMANNNDNTDRLVTICHYGRTIRVDKASVAWHLAHGDHLGACTADPT